MDKLKGAVLEILMTAIQETKRDNCEPFDGLKYAGQIHTLLEAEIQVAEERGIDTALTAYESTCEALIQEARKEIKKGLEKIAYNASDGTWRIIAPDKWQAFWKGKGVE